MHGGGSPLVKRRAAERLAKLQNTAVDVLERLLAEAPSDVVRLAAARDVLDRTGLKATNKLELGGAVAGVAGDSLTPEQCEAIRRVLVG